MILSDKRRNLVDVFMTRWKEIKELTYSGIETKRKQSNSLKAVARRSAEIAQILANDVQYKPRTVGAASYCDALLTLLSTNAFVPAN